ncbi:hypothetical protein BGW42_007514 [Actinomortierella wolfii]|nr:hypothetical protein BGW42_007514 [Actinomortierella wolfii]
MASALPPTGMSSSPLMPRSSSSSNTFPLSAARKLNLQPRAAAAIDFNDSDDDDENGLLSADYKAQRRTTQDLVDFFKTAPPPPSSTPIPLILPPEEEKKKRSLLQRLRPRKSGSGMGKSSNGRTSSIRSSTTMGNATAGLISNRSSVLVPGQNGYGGGNSSTATAIYANSSKLPGTSSSISAASGLTTSISKIDNSDKRSTMSGGKKYVMISIDYPGSEGGNTGYAPSITPSTPGGAYGGSSTRPSSIGAGVGVGSVTTTGTENFLGIPRSQSQTTDRNSDDFSNLFSANKRLSLLSSGGGLGIGASIITTTTSTITSSTLPHSTSATSGLSTTGQLGGTSSSMQASPSMISTGQDTAERRSVLLQTAGLDATPFLLDNFGLGSDFLNGISANNLTSTTGNSNMSSTSPTTTTPAGISSMVIIGKGLTSSATSPTTPTTTEAMVFRQSMAANSNTPAGTRQRTLSVRSNQTATTAKPYTADGLTKSESDGAVSVLAGSNSNRNSRAISNAMRRSITAGSDSFVHHAQLLLDEDIVTEALLQRIESHKARKLSNSQTAPSATVEMGTETDGVSTSKETEITLPKPTTRKKVRHVQIQTMHCVTRPMYTQTESSEVATLDDLEVKEWKSSSSVHSSSAGQGERFGYSATTSTSCQTDSQTSGLLHYRTNSPMPGGLVTTSLSAQPTSVMSTTTATSTLISTSTLTTTTTTTVAEQLSSLAAGISPHPSQSVTTRNSCASMSSISPSMATLSTATMTNHSTSSATTSACSSPSSPTAAAAAAASSLATEQELALVRQQNLQLQQQVARLERELASEMRARARSTVAMQDTRDKFEMLSALAYKKLKEMIFQRHVLEMEVRELRGLVEGGAQKEGTITTAATPNAATSLAVAKTVESDEISKAAQLVACAN